METVKVSKGRHFLKKGDRMKGLFVILQGSVRAVYKNDEIDMETGSIVGLMESDSGVYLCDYVAVTDCVLYAYPYRNTEDYKKIFASDEKYVAVFTMGAVRKAANMLARYGTFYKSAKSYYVTVMSYYDEYQKLCNDYQVPGKPFKQITSMPPVVLEHPIERWTMEYYGRMATFSLKYIDQFLGRDYAIGVGEIQNAVCWMRRAMYLIEELKDYLNAHKELLLSAGGEDLFQMYFELARKAASTGVDLDPVLGKISEIMEFCRGSHLFDGKLLDARFQEYENYDFYENVELGDTDVWVEDTQEAYEEGVDYLGQILTYSEYDVEKAEQFRQDVDRFKKLPDRLATTDDVRKLRRQITQGFYDIYELAFYRTLKKGKVPAAVKMFLNFGFMDESLAGEENTHSLYDMVADLSICKADNEFTIYEWLMIIYSGENEPSSNEFDMDYLSYMN